MSQAIIPQYGIKRKSSFAPNSSFLRENGALGSVRWWIAGVLASLFVCIVFGLQTIPVVAMHKPPLAPAPTPAPFYPQEHLWLSSPVADDAPGARPDRFYVYASTGQGRYQVHHGVEFVNPLGTPVLAVGDGTVVTAGWDDEFVWGRALDYYGQLVVIQLAQSDAQMPVYVLYGHLSDVYVTVGQRVQQGEPVGAVGSTGVALGPHLHFEVRLGRNTFSHTTNPELWLVPQPGHGTIVGRILDARGQTVNMALVTFTPVERPGRYWREAWTYPGRLQATTRSDPAWQENVVMGDVPVGEYIVAVRIEGRLYARRVLVGDGQLVEITIQPPPALERPPGMERIPR
jgi:murein DD-endopeptidase MepM/ murein hydrolase activator NlpD